MSKERYSSSAQHGKLDVVSETVAQEPEIGAVPRPTGFMSRTFRAFQYHDFRLMWSGAFTSTTGTWMQDVAQSWLVLEMTGSARYLGLLNFLANLPFVLFSLIGGVTADRFDRRKLLLGSQYTQMACAFVLAGLVWSGHIKVWHMMILVFVVGTGQSFGGPAYSALVPSLVKREDVPNAIALNSVQFNLARVLGPVLAGLALTIGPAICFFLNGVSYIAVIVTLYMINATFRPPKTQDSIMTGMRHGFAYVKSQGSLWQLSVLGFISTFCGIPLLTLLPIFAKDTFHMGASGYSYMMAMSGAGAITGALVYAGLARRERAGVVVLRVQIVFALLMICFALSHNIIVSSIMLFLAGACLIILFSSITSLVQLNISEELRGRVMSIFMLAFRGGMPLGSLVSGQLAAEYSASVALVTLSVALGGTALAFTFLGSGIKRL